MRSGLWDCAFATGDGGRAEEVCTSKVRGGGCNLGLGHIRGGEARAVVTFLLRVLNMAAMRGLEGGAASAGRGQGGISERKGEPQMP